MMDFSRRGVIGSLAGGGLVAAAATADARPQGAPDAGPAMPPPHRGPLVNRERAAAIMARDGLAGLVVTDPVNLYYFAGLDLTQFLRSLVLNSPGYAIIPKDPAQPVGLVLTSFGYHYSYAAAQPEKGVAVFQFSPGRDPALSDRSNTAGLLATGRDPLRPGEAVRLPNGRQAALTPLERLRETRTLRETSAHGVAADQAGALQRACRELGVTGGVIGCDASPTSAEWRAIATAAPGATLQPAAPTISRIRLVKSPQEILLMRYAAYANAEAARLACHAVRAGATSRELRRTFHTEAARRGGVGAWITIDGMSVDAYEETFAPGQSFMIDAVATFDGYHGDYGRTVFVGEPARSMRRHTAAIEHAWGAVRERLRPGLRFSQIQEIGQAALEKGGYDTQVRITPHSVGVLHTDAQGIGDIMLEPGMILSVDFPVLEAGIGGSAHLEDLTLITADGHELINPPGHQTIIV